MSVVPQDGTVGRTRNASNLQNPSDDCCFVNARDYCNDAGGYRDQEQQIYGGGQNSQSAEMRVAVVLGYFNGKSFIRDQLQSILGQTHSAVHVYLCDDNSEPSFSLDGLDLDQDAFSKISVCVRPSNVGCTNNFLKGLGNVSDDFEFFAFSDQDDIWDRDKLEKAIAALTKIGSNEPALYCARTKIVDSKCEETLGCSPLFNKPPAFANALVQNIAGGNTMVFNKAAKDLILEATEDVTVVSHDWWCYQIVTGVGGRVIYDPRPCLKYRQHARNLVGSNDNWRARLLRIRGLLRGDYRKWNDINLAALWTHEHSLTFNNRRALCDFTQARQSSLLKRLLLFRRTGIYRQTLLGNLGLLLAVFLNRV